MTIAVKLDSTRADIWYEKARYECQQRIFGEAIISLETACGFDGSYVYFAEYRDAEFKPLRSDPRFRRLVKSREDELERLGIRITWGEQDF